MEIKKHYRDDAALRRSFNALAEKTFGLNFENWYQNGFWRDDYDPYSVVEEGKVVANVSLNRTDMVIGGERRRIYQLGTVMTEESLRNRGYIRAIMAEIEKDTADADGVYLFGNDSVLEFYPKFGFVPSKEYIFSRSVSQAGPCRLERIPMDGPENWARLEKAIQSNTFTAGCTMADNPGLTFFYAAQFMQDCVYRDPETGAWIIAELEDGGLFLHSIFSHAPVTVDQIVSAFGAEVNRVTLGFSPADPERYTCQEHKEEDCTFFTKGIAFRDFEERKLRIPTLSHA